MLPLTLLVFAAAPPLADPLPAGAVARLGTVRFRHGFSVNAVAFSPDGRTLGSAGNGRGLCLWDARTGELLRHCSAERFPAASGLAFSPDGRRVVAASASSTIVWEARSGKEVHRLAGPGGAINVAWSADGRWIASVGHDRAARLWEASTGKAVRRLTRHRATPWTIAFSPDSRLVASADVEGRVVVANVSSGKAVWREEIKAGFVGLAFSGEWLVFGGADGKVRYREAATGKAGKEVEVGGQIRAIAAGGGLLAVGSSDGRISALKGGRVVRRWRASHLAVLGLAFAPDGRALASGGVWGSYVELWDAHTGRPAREKVGHAGPVERIQVLPGGREALSVSRDGTLARWQLGGRGLRLSRLPTLPGSMQTVAVSPTGGLVAISPWRTGEIVLCDGNTAAPLRRLGGAGKHVVGLEFSPDGRRLAGVAADDSVRIWDVRTGRQALRLGDGPLVVGSFPSLRFSPDGKRLLVITLGTGACLFDLRSGKLLRKSDFASELGYAAFSPDGKLVAISGGYLNPSVLLWETDTGNVRRAWRPGRSSVHGVAFSPDGRLLAAGGDEIDGRMLLLEVETGKPVAAFEGHTGGSTPLAFTPDGRRLLSGGGDSSILVWDVTGRAGRKGPPDCPERLWERLGKEDGAVQAVFDLAEAPDALKVLGRRLKPLAAPPVRELEEALDGLGSDDYETRQKATAALLKFGPGAIPALRRNLLPREGVEVYRGVKDVLEKLELSEETARHRRAVWALELMSTPAARALLKKLAGGAGGAPLTEEAKAALGRVGR